MATIRLTSPEGTNFDITAPDDYTEEQLYDYLDTVALQNPDLGLPSRYTQQQAAPQEGLPDYNTLRGMGERTAEVVGNYAKLGDRAATGLNETFQDFPSMITWGEGGLGLMSPREFAAQGGEEYRPLDSFAQSAKGLDLGYQEDPGWENAKQNWEEGNYFSAIGDAIPWGLKTGAVSGFDMLAAATNPAAYMASRTNEIAEERAQYDNRDTEDLTPTDLLAGAGTAAVVTALEKFGADKFVQLGRGTEGIRKGAAQGLIREGATEAVQEPIEYIGASLGTETGTDLATVGERSLQGLVSGGSFGSVAGGASGAYGKFRNRGTNEETDAPVDPNLEADVQRQMDAMQAQTDAQEMQKEFDSIEAARIQEEKRQEVGLKRIKYGNNFVTEKEFAKNDEAEFNALLDDQTSDLNAQYTSWRIDNEVYDDQPATRKKFKKELEAQAGSTPKQRYLDALDEHVAYNEWLDSRPNRKEGLVPAKQPETKATPKATTQAQPQQQTVTQQEATNDALPVNQTEQATAPTNPLLGKKGQMTKKAEKWQWAADLIGDPEWMNQPEFEEIGKKLKSHGYAGKDKSARFERLITDVLAAKKNKEALAQAGVANIPENASDMEIQARQYATDKLGPKWEENYPDLSQLIGNKEYAKFQRDVDGYSNEVVGSADVATEVVAMDQVASTLKGNQKKVYGTLSQALKNNELDKFVTLKRSTQGQSNFSIAYTELAKAAGIETVSGTEDSIKKAADEAIKQLRPKIAKQMGMTEEQVKAGLAAGNIKGFEGFNDTKGDAPTEQTSGVTEDDYLGEGAGMGTVSSISGTQARDAGASETLGMVDEQLSPEEVNKLRERAAKDEETRAKNAFSQMPASMIKEIKAEWDTFKSDDAVDFESLSLADKYKWAIAVAQFQDAQYSPNKAAKSLNVLSNDQRAIEKMYGGTGGVTTEELEAQDAKETEQQDDQKPVAEVKELAEEPSKRPPASEGAGSAAKRNGTKGSKPVRKKPKVEAEAERKPATAKDLWAKFVKDTPLDALTEEALEALDSYVNMYNDGHLTDSDFKLVANELASELADSFSDADTERDIFADSDEYNVAEDSFEDIYKEGANINFGDDKLFSKNGAAKNPTTRAAIENVLEQLTGKRSNWRVTIYDTTADAIAARVLGKDKATGTQGWVEADKNGTLHARFIAENIPAGNELAVFLHEVGAHIGMENILTDTQYSNLIKKIGEWALSGDGSLANKVAKATMLRVHKNVTNDGDYAPEMIAYFIEEAVKAGINPTSIKDTARLGAFGQWIRTLWSNFKRSLRRLGVKNIDKLTPLDVVNVAYGAAKLELDTTWHGTAADFRKFNHDYMNSGEGAQAFGWGTYLAERMGIAYDYWEKDTRVKSSVEYDEFTLTIGGKDFKFSGVDSAKAEKALAKQFQSELGVSEELAGVAAEDLVLSVIEGSLGQSGLKYHVQDMLTRNESNVEIYTKEAKKLAAEGKDTESRWAEEIVEDAKGWIKVAKYIQNVGLKLDAPSNVEGSLMRVDYAVAEDEFLDWDTPIADQISIYRKMQLAVSPSELIGKTLGAHVKRPGTNDILIPKGRVIDENTAIEIGNLASEEGVDFVFTGSDMNDHYIGDFSMTRRAIQDNREGTTVYRNLAFELYLKQFGYEDNQVKSDKFGRTSDLTMDGWSKAYELASKHLDKNGIKGIKFYDNATRPKSSDIRSRKNVAGLSLERAKGDLAWAEQNTPNSAAIKQYKDSIAKYEQELADIEKGITRNRVIFNDKNVIRVGNHRGANMAPGQIRFSKTEDAVKYMRGKVGEKFYTDSAKLLKKGVNETKFLHQFISDLKDKVPALTTWYETANEMDMRRNEIRTKVDKVAAAAKVLPQKELDQVNDFIAESTLSQEWGYDPNEYNPELFEDKDYKINKLMRVKFDGLSETQQNIIVDVFAHGEEMKKLKMKLAKEADVKDAFTNPGGLDGPYAPLKRFGNYAAELKTAKVIAAERLLAEKDNKLNRDRVDALKADPTEYIISYFNTPGQAAEFAAANKKNYAFTDHFERTEQVDSVRGSSYKVLEKVLGHINATDSDNIPAEAKRHFRDMVKELYYQSLDESSARMAGKKRLNRAGFDKNMIRSFLEQSRAESGFIASMEYGAKMNTALVEANQQVKDASGRRVYQDEYNMVASHYADMLKSKNTPIQDRVTAMTTVWMLTTSLGYHMTNATQPWMATHPKLAGDFGDYTGAANRLIRAYPKATKIVTVSFPSGILDPKVDINTDAAPEKYRALLNKLQMMKLLDVGMEEDLSGFSQFTTGYKIIDAPSQLMESTAHRLYQVARTVEAYNRVTSALAAYDLALKNPKVPKSYGMTAEEYAISIVQDTQGNFSRMDSPMVLKRLPKVMGQYRKYQFMMAWLYSKAFKQMFKGATPEQRAMGRRVLGYKLAHAALMGGLLGLPLMNLASMLWALLGEDDDEPADLKRNLRNALGNGDLADVILDGPMAYLGLDTQAKLGEQNIFSIAPYITLENYDSASMFKFFGQAISGPAGAVAGKWMDAVGFAKDGEYYKAAEKFLPKGLSNPMEAYRLATEGFSMKSGDVIVDPEEFNYSMLIYALGLPTSDVKRIRWTRQQQFEITEWYAAREKAIRDEYKDADDDRRDELRDEWVKVQDGKDKVRPFFGENGKALRRQPLKNLSQYQTRRDKKVQEYRDSLK